MTDTDRLAVAVRDSVADAVDMQFWGVVDLDILTARLIAAGVTLAPDTALQKAAQEVVKQAEADEDYDGQFIDYLVSYEVIDALRAALETKP